MLRLISGLRVTTLLSRSIVDQVLTGRDRRLSNPLLPVPAVSYDLGLPLLPRCSLAMYERQITIENV